MSIEFVGVTHIFFRPGVPDGASMEAYIKLRKAGFSKAIAQAGKCHIVHFTAKDAIGARKVLEDMCAKVLTYQTVECFEIQSITAGSRPEGKLSSVEAGVSEVKTFRGVVRTARKKAVLNPADRPIAQALNQLGFDVSKVSLGECFRIEFPSLPAEAPGTLDKMAAVLANPVTDEYTIEHLDRVAA